LDKKSRFFCSKKQDQVLKKGREIKWLLEIQHSPTVPTSAKNCYCQNVATYQDHMHSATDLLEEIPIVTS
jgi:hypothetical protein